MAYIKKTFVNGSTPAINATNLNNISDGVWEANPPGMVSYFANSTAPTGWLKCNGAAVSRTTYANLFAAIGTTYGSGDGSSTFNLPDLRAEFIRGLDDSRGVDTGRAIGSAQSNEVQSHRHYISSYYMTHQQVNGLYSMVVGDNQIYQSSYVYTDYSSGSETRPRNIAMLACIKY